MKAIKQGLYDLLYINNELSLTRIFLIVLFLIGISGCIGIYLGLLPPTTEIIDIIKWVLALVVGNKMADNIVAQVFGSPRNQMPGAKNPKGDVCDV